MMTKFLPVAQQIKIGSEIDMHDFVTKPRDIDGARTNTSPALITFC
jgi:hypothetical protein